MNHPFEAWLNQQNLNQIEQVPFDEAFLCYRVGAYRAAILFSHIGFLTILKHRLIKSKKPDGYNEMEWQKQVIEVLNDEREWESTVFDLTQKKDEPQKKKKAIFNISEDMRAQIRYWKDRRNDCAHYKENTIDGYHVEAFWAFLNSNLNRITVEGGVRNLLKKIEDFFDETKTASSVSIDPLIKEIPNTIEPKDYKYLWETIFNKNNSFNGYSHYDGAFKVANSLFTLLPKDPILDSLTEYIKTNQTFNEVLFLISYPERFANFNFSASEIRQIWKDRIFRERNGNIFPLFTYLISSSYIPLNEINEALVELLEASYYDAPSENELRILKQHSFMDCLKVKILDWLEKGFNTINQKSRLIALYIKFGDFDKEVLNKLCRIQGSSYPAFDLNEELISLFHNQPSVQMDFIAKAKQYKIDIPYKFKNIDL